MDFDPKPLIIKKKPQPQSVRKTNYSPSVHVNEETDQVVVKRYPAETAKVIRDCVDRLGIPRKEIARRINKPLSLIADIEKGTAIYDEGVHKKLMKMGQPEPEKKSK